MPSTSLPLPLLMTNPDLASAYLELHLRTLRLTEHLRRAEEVEEVEEAESSEESSSDDAFSDVETEPEEDIEVEEEKEEAKGTWADRDDESWRRALLFARAKGDGETSDGLQELLRSVEEA